MRKVNPLRALRSFAVALAVALAAAGVTIAVLVWAPLLGASAAASSAVIIWPEAHAERTVPEPPPEVERVTVLAVGDCMVHLPQLTSARTGDGYDFWPCFEPVASRIAAADLAVGNLETTLAGAEAGYTGYPTFNSPDAYAEALAKAGFDVLTTANNHTLDRGPAGLARTLEVLDRLRVRHTGTARSAAEAGEVLVAEVRGVRVAVLACTYGMNGFSVPAGKPWMVNVIDEKRMRSAVKKARAAGADIVVVSVHNGVEYERRPSQAQVRFERALVDAGADVVLGSHPHVLQPMEVLTVERSGEQTRTAFIAHSLGNFMSNQRERYRDTGVMVRLVFEKNLKTKATALVAVEYVPVWVDDADGSRRAHRVLPIAEAIGRGYQGVNGADRATMRRAWEDTTTHLGSAATTSTDPAAVVFWSAGPGR